MLNIVCINAGNYLGKGTEYVNILFDMVCRNISDKTSYKFIAFTDSPDGLDCEIDARPLPAEGIDGWWNKLTLFKQGLFPDGDRIVYLDLDTLITNGIDEIIKYDGKFAILRDFMRQEGFQSSVMAWEAGTNTHIWDEWLESGMPKTEYGDQRWIEKWVGDADILQDIYPECFVSYKLSAIREIPKNCKMVIFHGQPRPDEIVNGWVPYVWKVGGGTALELQHECNTKHEEITNNIKNALTLPYPWLSPVEKHEEHAIIVGGGPSLRLNLDDIRERQKHGQVIFATNNTYNYLCERGIIADCHIMLDARQENIEFLPKLGASPICYYASQLHPSILEKAYKDGNSPILWHSFSEGILEIIGENTGDALVGGGVTVGMKAIGLVYILGYRNLHLYGFDSSYEDGENHAYKQPLNDGERTLEVEMNGRKYKTAAWMCAQVENFKETAKAFVEAGGVLTVHGTGLLPDIARVLSLSTPAAQVRANEILMRLNVSNPVGAEIGVFTGDLSSRLLQRDGLTLYMVDSWTTSELDGQYAKSGDFHASLSQQQQDKHSETAKRMVNTAGERAKIIRKSSIEAAKDIPDKSLDFVFIDADHSYDGCKADILAWMPKLKSGALLSGHDYKNTDYPCFGVEKAVDEFCSNHDLPVELGDNFTWFVRIPDNFTLNNQ